MRPAIINGRIVHIGGTETDRLSSIGGQWFFEPQDVFPPTPDPGRTIYPGIDSRILSISTDSRVLGVSEDRRLFVAEGGSRDS